MLYNICNFSQCHFNGMTIGQQKKHYEGYRYGWCHCGKFNYIPPNPHESRYYCKCGKILVEKIKK